MAATTNTVTPKNILKRMVPTFLLAFLVLIMIGFVRDLQAIAGKIMDFNWSIFPLVILFTLFNYLALSLKYFGFRKYNGETHEI